MIRVLFVGGYRPFKYRRRGGPNAVSSPLIDAFALKAPREFQITVLSTPFRELAIPILKPLTIKLRGKIVLKYMPLLSALPLIMREVAKTHVVHVFAGGEPLSVLIQLISRILGKKTVVTFHSYDPIEFYYERMSLPILARKLREVLYRLSLKYATLIIFTSNFVRVKIQVSGLLTSETSRYVIVPNGTDLRPMYETKSKDEIVILSIVGNFPYRKGLDILFRVLEKLIGRLQEHQVKRRIRIVIVGKVPKDLQQLLGKLACTVQVCVLHGIPREELLKLYAGSHICVQLSRAEGFLLPALEAASQGCAVIISNRTGVAEVLRGAAIIVNIKDLEEVVSCIQRLLTDDKFREEIGRKCYLRSRAFTYDKVAARYLKCYVDVLKAKLQRGE